MYVKACIIISKDYEKGGKRYGKKEQKEKA